MQKLIKTFIVVCSAWMAAHPAPALAQNAAAKASGNWENPAIWTTGTVPNSAFNVYIGATDPAGAVTTASVTLTADEAASIAFVGYGSPTNGTLNLGGKKLTLGSLYLGYAGGSPGHIVEAGGSFSAGGLNMYGAANSLTLGAADTVAGIDIESSATLTTSAIGNITGGGNILTGGVLNLGADLNLSGGFNVQSAGTTLNLGGHKLTADRLDLGSSGSSAVSFQRGSGTPGTLNLNSLNLGNSQNVTLVAGDTLTGGGIMGVGGSGAVTLSGGSTLTTVDSLNVTCTVNVLASTLRLGADMFIGNQTINAANGAQVDLAGHNLDASYLLLGYSGTSTATLNRGSGTPGNLHVGNLFLGNGQDLTLIAGDTIAGGDDGVNVTAGATLNTATIGNLSNNAVNVKTGGAVNLGASLSTDGNLNVQDSGSTFNGQGHAVTAAKLLFGSNGAAAVGVSNLGTVTASELHVGHGTALALHGGDVIGGTIDLEANSDLTVEQSGGTGLTLDGTFLSSLTIDLSSMLLNFTSTTPGDWDFRWKNPNGSNWIDTLTTMINDQQINLTLPSGLGYQVVDSSGYTYIQSVVPEPSSLMLMVLGLAGLGAARLRRR